MRNVVASTRPSATCPRRPGLEAVAHADSVMTVLDRLEALRSTLAPR
jgi:hypothetical protein